eukprot:1220432-Prymnesium_polylepis.1
MSTLSEHFVSHGPGDCCRGARAVGRLIKLTPLGFAPKSKVCEAACAKDASCQFFSFSKTWKDCVLCRDCLLSARRALRVLVS